jgi:hypothetical protein
VVSLDAVGHPFHQESLDKWVDPFRVRKWGHVTGTVNFLYPYAGQNGCQ